MIGRHGDAYLGGHGDERFGVESYDLRLDYSVASNRLDGRAEPGGAHAHQHRPARPRPARPRRAARDGRRAASGQALPPPRPAAHRARRGGTRPDGAARRGAVRRVAAPAAQRVGRGRLRGGSTTA
nr:hypothetical protein [Angustibacter aerolatus]